jgi:hypothetical protein
MRLVHLGGGNAFDLAVERAMKWAWRVDGEPPDLTELTSGSARKGEGGRETSVVWTSVKSSAARAIEIKLMHPDQKDPTLRWQATTTITEVEGATRFTLRLQLGATVYSLRPWQISLRAPSIVLDLMQPPLLASVGELEMDPMPRIMSSGDVKALVKDQLRAEDRALPLLVASSEVDGTFLEKLARAVAGLLQVVRMRDGVADQALSKSLGGYGVPSAGLRLFWPGFGTERERHPYWTAAQVRLGARKRSLSVVGQLVELLAPISTGRVPVDAGFMRARQEWLQERVKSQRERDEAIRKRARRQRQSAQRARREAQELADEGEATQLRERLSDAEGRLALVEQERDDATAAATKAEERELASLDEAIEYSERLTKAEAENSDLHRNIKVLSQYRDGGDEDEGEALPSSISTWQEVAEHMEDLEGPGFRFTKQAHGCADDKNRYPSPQAMWKSLRALEQVGRAYNEMGADLGGRFDQFALEQAGITVALQDDSYEDCWFEYEGEWLERVPHVKIDDAKSPNEVGRIYFALDSEGKRVIVDWFGTKPDRPHTKRG